MPKRGLLCRETLTIHKRPNPLIRPVPFKLFPKKKQNIDCSGGIPKFSNTRRQFEVIRKTTCSSTQYRGVDFDDRMAALTYRPDFNLATYHLMKANIRFRAPIQKRYGDREERFKIAMRMACNDLFLVGGFICTNGYASGHLQGDVTAISQIRRWLEYRCNRTGSQGVTFWDESYGMREYSFKDLVVKEDFRSPTKKLQTRNRILAEVRASNFFRDVVTKQREVDDFFEAHGVRQH